LVIFYRDKIETKLNKIWD